VQEDPGVANPVTLLLLVSARPARPEVLAQVVLLSDPPQADVDLAIDVNQDLAFPATPSSAREPSGRWAVLNRGPRRPSVMHDGQV